MLFFSYSSSVIASDDWIEEFSRSLEELINSKPGYLLEFDRPVIADFYHEHDFEPLWLNEDGLLKRGQQFLYVVNNVDQEGLDPSDYYLDDIKKLRNAELPEEQVQLELLLSAAFYRYSQHVFTGRFNPKDVDADWHINHRPPDGEKLFARVSNGDSIGSLIKIIPPQHEGYQLLKKQLHRYREIKIQGGWQKIAYGPKLEPGVQHKTVMQLRRRLHVTGDLEEKYCCITDIYDGPLAEAVKRFQARHGLAVDGRVGPKTRAALNIPVSEKISLIRLNMERWRWMPRELGKRYLMVNMSGYELNLVDNGTQVLTMPVIIGKAYRATPSFSGWVSYMEFNPYWTIPRKLALQDIVPKQVSNPSYLSSRGIKVFRGWETAEEIDPQTVNWSEIDMDNFPYWLRQEPGPRNALGRIKFIFSNPYKVYLHGTPEKHLFSRVERAFSSGCIRVRDPVLLAAHLLDHGSLEKQEEVLATIHMGSNERVNVPTAAPIYLVYWTAWVDEDGRMNFRNDIYNRDTELKDLFGV